jgi:heterodisulfide reductase subunit A-like polyferredoxin
MARFDKTFPTLDCAACILTPKMVQVGKHPNIHLMAYSEVDEVSGYVGNFTVKVRHKAKYVISEKCNGCGMCWETCPAKRIPETRVIRKGKLVIGQTTAQPTPARAHGDAVAHGLRVMQGQER